MSTGSIQAIQDELAAFPTEEQERLGKDVVSYLRRLREIRDELDKAERGVAGGRTGSLADLDQVIGEIRRQHAGT